VGRLTAEMLNREGVADDTRSGFAVARRDTKAMPAP
jgi:hypothetical protein